jgi:biopolymer transport protein ExbD
MPVKKPKKVLGESIRLKFAKKGAHGKSSPIADLNVTPMVDMLTMLVIFLLMTFSANGEILFMSKDISLPKAYMSVILERAPVVAISPVTITFDGASVMKTAEANERWYADWKLTPLIRQLQKVKKNAEDTNPDKPFDGQIIIQSDGNVPFAVIKMVMLSCATAGYMNVNFAVQKVARDQAPTGGEGD